MERILYKWFVLFLTLWLYSQGASLTKPLNPFFIKNNKKFNLLNSNTESNINVSLLRCETQHLVYRKYDFSVPQVEVVCQCACANEEYFKCSHDNDCAYLSNSTTSCTIFITIDTDYSFCNKFYKLCCQVYFTKTKMMKSFKALELKYHQSLLKLRIFSQSSDGKLNTYNVTIAENVKHLLISPDKVLSVHQFIPARHIPDIWYFIEDGSNELLYSNAMNAIDELDMNKIGWFQSKGNGLSRVKRDDLAKHLQVKLLDCHSNPPIYEWKLNANSFVSKGLFHMPKNVETVSQMYKDISTISLDIAGGKITMGVINPSSFNITVVDASLHPFLFIISMKESVLNLTFTKGNGDFHVEITSPLWTDTLFFSASFPMKLIKLPVKNYDSSWVCVSQNAQQLCQTPPFNKYDVESITTSTTVRLNDTSEMDVPTNAISSISEIQYTVAVTVAVILGVSVAVIFLVLLVRQVLKNWRRMQRKESDVRDRMETEPLSPDRRRIGFLSSCMEYVCQNRSTNPPDQINLGNTKKDYRGVKEQVEQKLRRRCEKIRLPNISYMNLELHSSSDDKDETKGEPMELDELFNPIDGEDPVRILVEGEKGYGKTTLCLTLLNDWGKMRDYVSSKFKMIFLFELKYFKENNSIDKMLNWECEAIGCKDNDGIQCIRAFESETLLILDGFHEMNEECKKIVRPLIYRDVYPNMFIVVTIKTGMFEVEKRKKLYGGYYETNNVDIWHKRVLLKRTT